MAGHSDAADVGSAAAGFCSESSGPGIGAAEGRNCSAGFCRAFVLVRKGLQQKAISPFPLSTSPEAAQTMLNNAIEKNDEEKVKEAKEEVKAAEEKTQKAKPEKAIRCTMCSSKMVPCSIDTL